MIYITTGLNKTEIEKHQKIKRRFEKYDKKL